LERCAGAGVSYAGVAGGVIDQGLVVCAGAGQAAGAYAAIQFGEVALDHQRGGDGEECGVGGAAGVELVIGEEEKDFVAGMGDMAAEGERELPLMLGSLGLASGPGCVGYG